jgi:hypothetical protein
VELATKKKKCVTGNNPTRCPPGSGWVPPKFTLSPEFHKADTWHWIDSYVGRRPKEGKDSHLHPHFANWWKYGIEEKK